MKKKSLLAQAQEYAEVRKRSRLSSADLFEQSQLAVAYAMDKVGPTQIAAVLGGKTGVSKGNVPTMMMSVLRKARRAGILEISLKGQSK